MFNPRRLIGARWTDFTWDVFEWLTRPRLISLSLLMVIGLLILGSYPRWRRLLIRVTTVLLLFYWMIISPPFISLATNFLVGFLPTDVGGPADAIVVLSRGRGIGGDRYEEALDLWKSDRAPRIFVTGRSNFRLAADLVEDHNLPEDILDGTACASTTKDEAINTAAILGPEGVRKIILLTDPPHMLRSYLTFKGLGFSVLPHIVNLPEGLSTAEQAILALREYPGLVSYAILGRFNPKPPEALSNPSPDILKQVRSSRCLIKLSMQES